MESTGLSFLFGLGIGSLIKKTFKFAIVLLFAIVFLVVVGLATPEGMANLSKMLGPAVNYLQSHVLAALGAQSAIFLVALGLGIWKG